MTHFKLGLFALAALAGVVIAVLALGLRTNTPVIRYHTYIDESVQGLDVGSPVDYRGVAIGSVGAIAVAPDGRLIDVALDIHTADAGRLEQPALRAQLSNQGITGLKFVDIDWAPQSSRPILAFPPAGHYVPSQPSLFVHLGALAPKLSKLVDSSTTTVERLGRVLDHADATIRELRGLDELEHTLRDIGDAARSFHDLVEDVERDPDMLVKGRARS